MKKSLKTKTIILAGAIALGLPVNAMAATTVDTKAEVNLTAGLIQSRTLTTDWEVAALAKANLLTKDNQDSYLAAVKTRVDTKDLKGADLEKTIIVLRALGENPRNYEGQDLIKKLYSDSSLNDLTGFTYALIALDSADYTIPSDALWTKEKLIDKILSLAAPTGGWGWSGGATPDPDTTGIVLEALSKHKDMDSVDHAVAVAVDYLDHSMKPDGGFDNYGENSCSTAEVVIGLTANGIDPTKGLFNNNGNNPITFIHSYKFPNGAYRWVSTETAENTYATDEVFQSLVADELLVSNDSLFSFPFPSAPAAPTAPQAVGNANVVVNVPPTDLSKLKIPQSTKETIREIITNNTTTASAPTAQSVSPAASAPEPARTATATPVAAAQAKEQQPQIIVIQQPAQQTKDEVTKEIVPGKFNGTGVGVGVGTTILGSVALFLRRKFLGV